MKPSTTNTELVEVAPTMPDDNLLRMAMGAKNAAKFNALWSGDFNSYPSQSEADHALIALLAFYTPSNEQVRRMFREKSALGQREKATRNDRYIDRSLSRIRGGQMPLVDLSGLIAAHQEESPKACQE